MKQLIVRGIALVACAFAATATAQVRIGVTVSATGPAASLGIPEKQHRRDVPEGRSPARPSSTSCSTTRRDTTTAVQNTRKLIGESKVDAIIGSTTTPNSLAMLDVFADGADADDLARVVGAHHRAGRREARLVVQDAADRRDDGRRDPRARGRDRREDAGLRRLLRCARRGVLRRDREGGDGAQDSARRQRALRAQGHERRRPGAEADRGEARRRS